jgi:hypothetical protein
MRINITHTKMHGATMKRALKKKLKGDWSGGPENDSRISMPGNEMPRHSPGH